MRLFGKKPSLAKLKVWFLYAFISLIIMVAMALFGIITQTSDSSKNNSRRIFESTQWNALQLQIQSYRFLNYLVELDDISYSLQGDVFSQYDLLMSRVDLLRRGDIGLLIRNFEKGRIIRLLNIINGELELLSFNVSKIDNGDASYLPNLIERIKLLEHRVNELVTLVNKGSTEYINNEHTILQKSLDSIQLLSITLLVCLLLLCFFTIKGLSELRKSFKYNKKLKVGMQIIHEDKANILTFIHQEVRSPINAILGITKTLNNTQSIEATKELSKHIEESGYQLLHTVERLSNLALIGANKLSLTYSTENLQEKVEDYLATLEPQMSRKGLQGIVYIDPMLPAYVTLDFIRVKEIIATLLQNAIAHTPSGSISLQIRPSTLSIPLTTTQIPMQESRMLKIAIKDTGLGMPSRLQENLRKSATILLKKDEQILDKIGLNLALCYKLVHLMKGEINFFCAPKNGCEFWVDIPFYVPNNSLSTKNPSFLSTTKRQALLLEADTHLAKALKQQLAAFNIDVTYIKEEGFQENKHYDVIILGNTNWFEQNGHDVIQQWHKKAYPIISYHPSIIRNPDLPVIELKFPLVQSQLEHILSNLFPQKI